jgi:lipid II:glycine glycyltransferase (peptidoglycan interpeptide bridge formation enzyme)
MNWNETIEQLPGAHLLQTEQWAHVKGQNGWKPYFALWGSDIHEIADSPDKLSLESPVAGACVHIRTIPLGGFAAKLSIAYIPKGPLLDWSDKALRERVLADLRKFARKKGAIFLKIDPEVVLGTGIPAQADAVEDSIGQATVSGLQKSGWLFANDQIQFRNTVTIDLSPDEETLLANMKQKTRYNVRLAARKGVKLRVADAGDFDLLYKMYAETSVRDGFVIRGQDYYETVWRTFSEAGMLEPLIATVEAEGVDPEPVAAMTIFRFAGKALYMHGMSRDLHRNKMPTYFLQWEAMRRAKEAGCTVYDLWGASDIFDESDSMWGVFRFKQGLGGQVVRHIGAWDYPIRPIWFKLYAQILPKILDVMRKRGKKQTAGELG